METLWFLQTRYPNICCLEPVIHPRPLVNTTNEHIVLRNYGATETESSEGRAAETSTAPRPLRVSRSMTFAQGSASSETATILENGRGRALPSNRRGPPLRSLSIGGLSAWSNGYREIGSEDLQLLIEPDEPPPPYEVWVNFLVILDIEIFSGRPANVCSALRKTSSVHFFSAGFDLAFQFERLEIADSQK